MPVPMPMKVSFELSAKDLRYFRSRLETARKGRASRDEAEIVRHAMELVVEAVESDPPEFVLTRLEQLRRLTEMLGDLDWNLVGRDRARILDALTYFIEPNDLIPDRTPGIGYLDDAIMIELIARELKHDVEAYEDFCALRRRTPGARAGEKLGAGRERLQARMRRRRRRQRDNARRMGSGRSPFRLL